MVLDCLFRKGLEGSCIRVGWNVDTRRREGMDFQYLWRTGWDLGCLKEDSRNKGCCSQGKLVAKGLVDTTDTQEDKQVLGFLQKKGQGKLEKQEWLNKLCCLVVASARLVWLFVLHCLQLGRFCDTRLKQPIGLETSLFS